MVAGLSGAAVARNIIYEAIKQKQKSQGQKSDITTAQSLIIATTYMSH